MQFSADLISVLSNAARIVTLTGAGVSAESGIPTFREAQTGFWARYDPTELATPQAFEINPVLVWGWYAWRRDLCAAAEPNPAHIALAALEQTHTGFSLITQNVDNLHQRAGSRKVIELHGNIFRTRCSVEGTIFNEWNERIDSAPVCPDCGAQLRPDVVWFTEPLPQQALSQAAAAARQADVFLAVGTSALVHPAAALPLVASDAGAVLVEINPQPTPLSDKAHHVLRGPAGTILPELVLHITGKNR